MNAEISETIRARLLGFGMQIPELLTQRKLCHAHSNAQNCGSYSVDARIQIVTEMYCPHQYLSISPKKSWPRPLQRPQTSKNRKYERGYLRNYQR